MNSPFDSSDPEYCTEPSHINTSWAPIPSQERGPILDPDRIANARCLHGKKLVDCRRCEGEYGAHNAASVDAYRLECVGREAEARVLYDAADRDLRRYERSVRAVLARARHRHVQRRPQRTTRTRSRRRAAARPVKVASSDSDGSEPPSCRFLLEFAPADDPLTLDRVTAACAALLDQSSADEVSP